MRLVEWDTKYCLGIDLFDCHHRYLIELLNRFYNAISLKRGLDEISSIYQQLLEYSDHHVKTEEELMIKMGYSRIYSHVSEHEMFKNRLNELQGNQVAADVSYYSGIVRFLEDWLRSHILIMDKDFAEFVKANSH